MSDYNIVKAKTPHMHACEGAFTRVCSGCGDFRFIFYGLSLTEAHNAQFLRPLLYFV